jgi:hypothetical protein
MSKKSQIINHNIRTRAKKREKQIGDVVTVEHGTSPGEKEKKKKKKTLAGGCVMKSWNKALDGQAKRTNLNLPTWNFKLESMWSAERKCFRQNMLRGVYPPPNSNVRVYVRCDDTVARFARRRPRVRRCQTLLSSWGFPSRWAPL